MSNHLSNLNVPMHVAAEAENQSFTHTHTAAGVGEEVGSDGVAFDAGATIEIKGQDTPVSVGKTKAMAESGRLKYGAGDVFLYTLDDDQTTVYIDAATGGEVTGHQLPG